MYPGVQPDHAPRCAAIDWLGCEALCPSQASHFAFSAVGIVALVMLPHL